VPHANHSDIAGSGGATAGTSGAGGTSGSQSSSGKGAGGGSSSTGSSSGSGGNGASTKIYVSFISHNEVAGPSGEGLVCSPVYSDKSKYVANRKLVKYVGDELKKRNVHWNMQSDTDFLEAVKKYDAASDVTADTGGKNIIAYLASLGTVTTDAHHHPGKSTMGKPAENYADVAKRIQDLGGNEQGIVGGFVGVSTSDGKFKSEVDELLTAAKNGMKANTSSYVWKPKIFWGPGPHTNDAAFLQVSGQWRPKSGAQPDVHDPNGPMPLVGSPHDGAKSGGDLADMVSRAQSGKLQQGRMYTVTLMMNQCGLTQKTADDYLAIIDSYSDETASGLVVWKSLTATIADWQSIYGGEAFRDE
jgi:hypothetical protein